MTPMHFRDWSNATPEELQRGLRQLDDCEASEGKTVKLVTPYGSLTGLSHGLQPRFGRKVLVMSPPGQPHNEHVIDPASVLSITPVP